MQSFQGRRYKDIGRGSVETRLAGITTLQLADSCTRLEHSRGRRLSIIHLIFHLEKKSSECFIVKK